MHQIFSENIYETFETQFVEVTAPTDFVKFG